MNDAPYDIRAADPADAVALSALAHRAKAYWGYPSEWLAHWSEELTLTHQRKGGLRGPSVFFGQKGWWIPAVRRPDHRGLT